ncbi:MAG TPA: ribonuclease P protein component [Candidatus Limnocylindrales bacterium]|nr:ribonuclease P protein component [Candidatus Limnocylindrales bacterium]
MDAARLRRSKDIALVRAEGLLRTDRHFSMRARRSGGDAVRIALATPRSIGSAVRRNRVRRRLREAMRVALARRERAPGTDVLVVARPAALRAPAAELRSAVARELDAALGDGPSS